MKKIYTEQGAFDVSEEHFLILSWIATQEKDLSNKRNDLKWIQEESDLSNPYWQNKADELIKRIWQLQGNLWGLDTAARCLKIDGSLILHASKKPEDFRNMYIFSYNQNLSPKQ